MAASVTASIRDRKAGIQFFTPVTALYQVAPWLQLGSIVFHETADATDSTSTSGLNLGGICTLGANYNLLFSAGKNLRDVASTNQRSIFLALQVLH